MDGTCTPEPARPVDYSAFERGGYLFVPEKLCAKKARPIKAEAFGRSSEAAKTI
jgi:hypothetical protein